MKTIKFMLVLCALCYFIQVNGQPPACMAVGSHYTANYDVGWSRIDNGDALTDISATCSDNKNGTIDYSGAQCSFITARGSRELRISTTIATLSNTNWTMDFKLTINNPPSGGLANHNPGAQIAVLSGYSANLHSCANSFCQDCTTSGNAVNTSMDAIWVELGSNLPINP